MKFDTWTCGTLAGIFATIFLKIVTFSLYFLNLIGISEAEYAARFITHLPDAPLEPIHWLIGIITNFSLGALFGVLCVYLYKFTGFKEKYVKILGIGVLLWFFHLAIVPFLEPSVAKFSTARTVLEFYVIYMLWSLLASLFIFRYLKIDPTR